MLVFAALTPHPLISIPDIEKEHISKIRNTMRSFRELANELYAAQPDTIIVITSHPPVSFDAFTINSRPHVIIEFSKYGNLTDRIEFKNDVGFGYDIKESAEVLTPVVLTEEEFLDYGSSIPLFHVMRGIKPENIKIVPIGVSSLSLEEHYSFGVKINQQIHRSTKRIAVIASGDLCHSAHRNDVTGYNPKAYAFNKFIRRSLAQKDIKSLLAITKEDLASVHQCGVRSICVLLGILDQRNYTSSVLSYESAMGIGYISVYFKLA